MKFAKNFELFSLACFPRPPRLSVGVRVPLARRLASPTGRRAFGTRSTPRLGSSSAPAGRSPGRVAVGAYPAFFFFVSPVPAGCRSSRLLLRQVAVVPLSRPGHAGPAGASRAAGLEAHRDRPVLEADRDQAAPPAVDQRNRNARPGQRAGRLIAGDLLPHSSDEGLDQSGHPGVGIGHRRLKGIDAVGLQQPQPNAEGSKPFGPARSGPR